MTEPGPAALNEVNCRMTDVTHPSASSRLRRSATPGAGLAGPAIPHLQRREAAARDGTGRDTKLRICLVSETMITGVGRHVTDLAKGMARRGHDVHVLHSSLRFDRRLTDELDEAGGITRLTFPMRIQPHWSDLRVLLALARYIRDAGPFDVVHGHSSKGGLYARLLGLVMPATILYSAHSFVTFRPNLSRPARLLYSAVERGLGYLTHHMICVSHAERDHARYLGISADRLRTIPIGVGEASDPVPVVDLRRRFDLPDHTVLVGFVGRMDDQKAPYRLIEAALHVLRRSDHIHFVMLGEGPLRQQMEERVKRLGIADHFFWCGNERGVDWIPGFDVLAMPSKYEGSSYVLLEALRAGVPVVCTPVAGATEMVIDGVEGFLIPHDDANALAARLIALADQPAMRRMMGEIGRRSAELYTLDRMIDRVEATYLSVPAS